MFQTITNRRKTIIAAHPELSLNSRSSDLSIRLARFTTGSGRNMSLKDGSDLNEARALLAEIDKLNADWASVGGISFGLFVSEKFREALVEHEEPTQIIRISDSRIEGESFNGLAFRDMDSFRAVMEADGQGHKVDEILADPDVLEALTATGDTWEGERFPGEIVSGPVFRSQTGDLWVLPDLSDFQQYGYSCDISCIHSTDTFRDFA